ncbi:hypothetical protein ElP_51480 [Tautonia plasticadhaerens]|uniref:Double-GTPase 2 domain-containing protein n=2 Tax=Tautonia plasticadhaerens TaxID=2527974 RepID=A0A518H8P7_9BACT|nr:hypothetical protein ElP_51480 [Tautonia plasticadhaerens]
MGLPNGPRLPIGSTERRPDPPMPLDLLTRLDPLRRVQCPYCFERFAAFELHVKCDSPACETDFGRQVEDPILTRTYFGSGADSMIRSPWWADPRRDARRGLRRHLDWMVLPGRLDCPACGNATDCRLCPRCHQRLPDAAISGRPGHITIFGPQSVGKTTYMTVVLHELDQRFGPERGLLLEPIDEEVRRRYSQEYRDVTYGSAMQGIGVGQWGEVSRQAHMPTPPLEVNRRVLQPLVYRVKRRGASGAEPLLSFSDLAGEDWEMNFSVLRREAGHLIRKARGLLLLIDPLRIPQVARDSRVRLTPKEAIAPPAEYREDLSKLAAFFDRTPVKVPLAICLNKLDRWGPLMAPGTALHEVATSVPGELGREDSDRLIHEEVRAAMRRWDQLSFLEHLEIDFPRHRFFACSALGDAAQEEEDSPQPLPTPLLVDRPLLWLLKQQQLIR